jgi:hypothetical protein
MMLNSGILYWREYYCLTLTDVTDKGVLDDASSLLGLPRTLVLLDRLSPVNLLCISSPECPLKIPLIIPFSL